MEQPLTELQEIGLALAEIKVSLDRQSESISTAKIELLGCSEKSGNPTPALSIHEFCMGCAGCGEESRKATRLVRECPQDDCPLHPFREGKNPFRKLNLTTEQRKQRSDLAKSRFSKREVSL